MFSISKIRVYVGNIIPETWRYTTSVWVADLTNATDRLLKGLEFPWQNCPEFLSISENMKGRSLLDRERQYILYQFAKQTTDVPGDILELGCYNAANFILLTCASQKLGKEICLLDSFEGLQNVHGEYDPSWKHGQVKGDDFEVVRAWLEQIQAGSPYRLIKGIFPDDIDLGQLPLKLSFVHIDFDCYEPTLEGLIFAWERLADGGCIVVDDCFNVTCSGVLRACEEFSRKYGVSFLYVGTVQAIFIKNSTS